MDVRTGSITSLQITVTGVVSALTQETITDQVFLQLAETLKAMGVPYQ